MLWKKIDPNNEAGPLYTKQQRAAVNLCLLGNWDNWNLNFFSLEDTTPGKPKFGDIESFQNAILVRWLPPDNDGLVCVTGYRLWWGENMPFHFSAEPLSGDKYQYLIKNLSEYKIILFFHFASIWNLTDPAKKKLLPRAGRIFSCNLLRAGKSSCDDLLIIILCYIPC